MRPIIAHHVIFGAYGFWLPNDPRGSGSTFVGNKSLYHKYGAATKVSTRVSRAHAPHDRQRRLAARELLKFAPVRLNGRQALEVAHSIAEIARQREIAVWACAVMPDHVHLVTSRLPMSAGQLVGRIRASASRRLHESGLWAEERIWGKGQWDVFLHSPEEVHGRIEYVERNPVEAGLPPQRWSFIVPYAPS